MVGTILYQLTRSMTPEQIKRSGYDTYFVDHTAGVFPQFASGTPWTAATIGVTGDVIADLSEDMSAEQKARKTYDNILRLCDDPDVTDVIRFLREREVVHYQRFGEALRLATEKMDQKNVYAVNPAFDRTWALIPSLQNISPRQNAEDLYFADDKTADTRRCLL